MDEREAARHWSPMSLVPRFRWMAACLLVGAVANVRAAADAAGQEAAGIVAGIQKENGACLVYNPASQRLEVRDDLGRLLEEISPGTVSRTVDAAGQEYRLSFGRDDSGRPSVLVRPGPAMRKPILVEVFGRKAVLSPDSSLMATLADKEQVFYEPSICGEVYYLENAGSAGSRVSRLATSQREVAILAKPSSPTGAGPGSLSASQADEKEMEKAGESFKSAVFAVLGLPDKQPSGKAKVYRLRSAGEAEEPSEVAPPVSAEAGRP